jgi:hypothetical protein
LQFQGIPSQSPVQGSDRIVALYAGGAPQAARGLYTFDWGARTFTVRFPDRAFATVGVVHTKGLNGLGVGGGMGPAAAQTDFPVTATAFVCVTPIYSSVMVESGIAGVETIASSKAIAAAVPDLFGRFIAIGLTVDMAKGLVWATINGVALRDPLLKGPAELLGQCAPYMAIGNAQGEIYIGSVDE